MKGLLIVGVPVSILNCLAAKQIFFPKEVAPAPIIEN
jgi:hypothetical protein